MFSIFQKLIRNVEALREDCSGAVMTEYIVVIGTIAIGVSIAIAALGPLILQSYDRSHSIMLAPMP